MAERDAGAGTKVPASLLPWACGPQSRMERGMQRMPYHLHMSFDTHLDVVKANLQYTGPKGETFAVRVLEDPFFLSAEECLSQLLTARDEHLTVLKANHRAR